MGAVLDKIEANKEKTLAIAQFLKWLVVDKQFAFCHLYEFGYMPEADLTTEALIAEYMGIDLKAAELEALEEGKLKELKASGLRLKRPKKAKFT